MAGASLGQAVAFASVVRTQARPHVGSHAGVIAISIPEAPEHIHEAFLRGHEAAIAQRLCRGESRGINRLSM